MEQKQQFKIDSSSPLIQGVSVEVVREEQGYAFKAGAMNSVPNAWELYHDKGYGFFDAFTLKREEAEWHLPDGVSLVTKTLSTGVSNGMLGQVNNRFNDQTPTFHRLVVRQNLHHRTLTKHIESNRVQVGSTMRGGGLVNISIGEAKYVFYDFPVKQLEEAQDQTYYFIDSSSPVLCVDFEKAVGAIIHASAFITGELPRDEMYIVQAKDSVFHDITGAQYRRLEKSIDTGMDVVAPLTMRSLKIGEMGTGYVSEAVLSALASHAYHDARILRALKIVVESGLYPLEIRGATYSVALETIKEVILEVYQDTVKPFRDKTHARSVIKRLREIIEGEEEERYNDKRTLLSKLDNLNAPANAAGFAACFEKLGIELNQRDLRVLNNRNDFLHGRIPFEDEFKGKENHELKHIVYRYHFLLSALVLKFCGYSGYIKNNATFFNAIARPSEKADESLFRMI